MTFTLIPAIDLRGGNVVRLVEGDFDRETVFSEDPAQIGRNFLAAGAHRLHVVDLDGARSGQPQHLDVIRTLANLGLETQVGGGIRDLATIRAYLGGVGARWVILGTAALRNPQLVAEASAEFPGQIIVGIDARAGKVAVEGWLETSETTAKDLARRVADAGAAAIIYTDIFRDGTGKGPNVGATVALAEHAGVPVIASGGVDSLEHLRALSAHAPSIAGAVVGRALYAGRIDLVEALALTR